MNGSAIFLSLNFDPGIAFEFLAVFREFLRTQMV